MDLTRLISRAGRVLTGVDRVELAYLRHFAEDASPTYGLVRSTLGYCLLDRQGMEQIRHRIEGEVPWGRPDVLSLLARKKPAPVRAAESDLRRLSMARCSRGRLGRMLSRHLSYKIEYFNVGHSNLTERTFAALRDNMAAGIHVLVHDALPLDYPEYQRPGTPEAFRAKLKTVRNHATRLIYNSAYTQERVTHHMAQWGPVPDGVIAPLGVDVIAADPANFPPGLDLSRPYFVTVGTIEPRKRHDLLLDVWEDLIEGCGTRKAPGLFICGARGWNNDAVFKRLDALPVHHPVQELPGLSDGAVAALVASAQGMIFPSDAEGYGLPPIEAVCLKTPVICQDLPVYRETLGDIPVYLKAPDRYLLKKLVQSLLSGTSALDKRVMSDSFDRPSWDDHFDRVLGVL